ncbi:hypothetical protein CGSSp19BS75_00566 [Streptococcus pneumoniae SP19-BS75]|nr:hypothetical protein CGSSp19BS75_00566 [Streptococcus pneumoniae SP19-BS75]
MGVEFLKQRKLIDKKLLETLIPQCGLKGKAVEKLFGKGKYSSKISANTSVALP